MSVLEWIDFNTATGQGEIVAPPIPENGSSITQVQHWITIKAFQEMIMHHGIGPGEKTLPLHYINLCNDYSNKYLKEKPDADNP